MEGSDVVGATGGTVGVTGGAAEVASGMGTGGIVFMGSSPCSAYERIGDATMRGAPGGT